MTFGPRKLAATMNLHLWFHLRSICERLVMAHEFETQYASNNQSGTPLVESKRRKPRPGGIARDKHTLFSRGWHERQERRSGFSGCSRFATHDLPGCSCSSVCSKTAGAAR